jgi:Skp family chaperone for outer membrane proteins
LLVPAAAAAVAAAISRGKMCQILTQPQAAAAEIKKKFAARDENKNVQSFSLSHG